MATRKHKQRPQGIAGSFGEEIQQGASLLQALGREVLKPFLLAIAGPESTFGAKSLIRAERDSHLGLYQINQSQLNNLRGGPHGQHVPMRRPQPLIGQGKTMAVALMRYEAPVAEALGKAQGEVAAWEIYTPHLLGETGGLRFLEALRQDPNQKLKDVRFEHEGKTYPACRQAAYKANFVNSLNPEKWNYDNVTVGQVAEMIHRKFDAAALSVPRQHRQEYLYATRLQTSMTEPEQQIRIASAAQMLGYKGPLGVSSAPLPDAVVAAPDTTRHMQLGLLALGFDPKGIDGRMGPNTRKAVSDYLGGDLAVKPDKGGREAVAQHIIGGMLEADVRRRIAQLDQKTDRTPVETKQIQAGLQMLGFYDGKLDGRASKKMVESLERFREDGKTRAKRQDDHGPQQGRETPPDGMAQRLPEGDLEKVRDVGQQWRNNGTETSVNKEPQAPAAVRNAEAVTARTNLRG